jgi:hypothetical protein
MAQLKNVVDPFGEVNVKLAPGGKVRVTATILMDPHKEGCQTGIALDGSGSMSALYGVNSGAPLSSVFVQRPTATNLITPVAQKVCAYLARKMDADGGTTCIYWATGPGGKQVEEVGDLTADQAERHNFVAPRQFGTGTQLLPAARYFADRFKDAPYGFYVFVTDGALHDLEDVKSYTVRLARQIAQKQRNPLKFVLIGVGDDVDERQMEELDDLDADVDLWDHKLASELRVLEQIFAEEVDKNARVAPKGRVLDPNGKVLADYSDTGVPAILEFDAPPSAQYFTLELPGFRLHQGLMDTAKVPGREDTAPFAEPVKEEPPLAAMQEKATPQAAPVAAPKSDEINIDEVEPTLPGLDFKLEYDKDKTDLDFDKGQAKNTPDVEFG